MDSSEMELWSFTGWRTQSHTCTSIPQARSTCAATHGLHTLAAGWSWPQPVNTIEPIITHHCSPHDITMDADFGLRWIGRWQQWDSEWNRGSIHMFWTEYRRRKYIKEHHPWTYLANHMKKTFHLLQSPRSPFAQQCWAVVEAAQHSCASHPSSWCYDRRREAEGLRKGFIPPKLLSVLCPSLSFTMLLLALRICIPYVGKDLTLKNSSLR